MSKRTPSIYTKSSKVSSAKEEASSAFENDQTKIATRWFKCRTMTCKSEITCEIRKSEDGGGDIRIVKCHGGGTCNSQWFSLSTLMTELEEHDERIWSGAFEEIFKNKCNNTSSFLLAALCHEGVLVFRIDQDRKKTRSPYWLMLSSTAEKQTRAHNSLSGTHR